MKVVLTLECTLQVVQTPEAQICARNSTFCRDWPVQSVALLGASSDLQAIILRVCASRPWQILRYLSGLLEGICTVLYMIEVERSRERLTALLAESSQRAQGGVGQQYCRIVIYLIKWITTTKTLVPKDFAL